MSTRVHVTTESLQPSANRWDSTYTIVAANSAFWSTEGLPAPDVQIRALSSVWQDASTVVQANSAAWIVDNSVDTEVRALTGNWESTYTTFKITSSTFLTSETDSQTLSFNEVTKDLSISNGNSISLSAFGTGADTQVRELTSNWELAYDVATAYQAASSTFLTSETDSQLLSFDEVTKELSISNGNIVSLSSLIDDSGFDLGVRSLTGNWESTYTTVQTYSSSWEETADIIPTITNYLSTNNVVISSLQLLESELIVGSSGATTFYVEDGKIGINTETPNEVLTVVGNISSTGQLFGDGSQLFGIIAGDTEATTLVRESSANWQLTYTTFRDVSSTFLTSETDSQTLTFDEGSKELTISSGNTVSLSSLIDSSVDVGVRALTGNWESTYTTFNTTSSTYIKTQATSVPGVSAVTMIIAVSALPATQQAGTLYILL